MVRIYNIKGMLLQKECKKCGLIKDVNEFDKQYNGRYLKDGYRNICSHCVEEMEKTKPKKKWI